MADVFNVIKYFLFLNQKFNENIKKDATDDILEIAKPITCLKMQKLLYYAQGTHWSYFKKKLFEDDIMAYKHGPVVETVYQKLKNQYGKDDCLKPEEVLAFNEDELNDCLSLEDKDTIKFVFRRYGRYTPEALEKKTHDEAPWSEVYDPDQNKLIKFEQIQAFFDREYEKRLGEIMQESVLNQGLFK